MGNQQAHRAVNEQVAGAGRGARRVRVALRTGGVRGSRVAGRSDGHPVTVEVAAMVVRVAARTDRLVTWREEQSSRQVF